MSPIAWIIGVVVLAAIGLIFRIKSNRASYQEILNEVELERKKYEERERHKKLDNQLNVGRRVYNRLIQLYGEYENLGLELSRREDNGGVGYTIYVKYHGSGMYPDPVVTISFNFLEEDHRTTGYVFYGPYGPGAYFDASDHFVMHAVNQLVIPYLDDKMSRHKKETTSLV